MRVRQHRSGSSLDDSPLTGEIAPPSEAGEATRLNPLVHRQAASRLTDRGWSATSTTFPPARLVSD
jgi:hypothetical protein